MDSGATDHFVLPSFLLENIQISNKTTKVYCTNGSSIISSKESLLPINDLPDKAKTAHVLQDIKYPLISVPKLCDNDCNLLFTKCKAHIMNDKFKIISSYDRDKQSGFWTLPNKKQKLSISQ